MEGLAVTDGIGQQFMQLTRHASFTSDQQQGVRPPPVAFTNDQGEPEIDLPRPDAIDLPSHCFRNLAEQRTSLRKYSAGPLTIEELSFLLWCTQGVKQIVANQATLRTVPSAGARHAFETVLLVNRVVGLEPGLYHYLALDHKLICTDTRTSLAAEVTACCFGQSFVQSSATTFIWIAVPYRMTWRYGQRGYRYLHLDAGHVCQNLYLAAEDIDAGACGLAAFDDDALNRLLGLDGDSRFVIYLAPVGKKPARR